MPERAETRPKWPAWYGLAALGMALVIAVVASGILFAVLKVAGVDFDADSPGVNITATLIQDGALAVCAVWLAAQVGRPQPWQFGVRGTPFLRGLKWAAIAFAIYFGFQILYVAAVHPHEEQTTLQDLGAGNGAAITLLIGVLVVGVAPAVEEFFFRGFFYSALRTRFSFLAAALIDGVVFGAVHAPTGIAAVPPLVALGFAFCLAYEATGSILPGVVLHALNNMVAFGTDKDGSWAVGATVAGLVLIACVTLPGRSRTLSADATGGADDTPWRRDGVEPEHPGFR
ncbi:MAG: CPBP family intramembrane glutamic endopeptidase [Catenulispora sp.]